MTTGIGKDNIRSASSNPAVSMVRALGPPARNTFRSNPAENTPGRPASATIAASASALLSASLSSASISGDSTFTLPSSIVIRATEPSESYRTRLPIGRLLSRPVPAPAVA